jgi:hypothetical protein
MDDKYYTPSLEEFHVGFEYQYKTCNEINNNLDWKKRTMDFMDMCDIGLEINNDPKIAWQYRVKYLDKEDIESLGFKFSELFGYVGYSHCILPSYTLSHFYEIVMHDDPTNVKFFGEIKNKSELKVLLKQLQIL